MHRKFVSENKIKNCNMYAVKFYVYGMKVRLNCKILRIINHHMGVSL